MLVDFQNGEIIALAFSNGKKHDFQLFKESRTHVKAETVLEADTGYLGLAQIHANSLLPKKRSKNHPLTDQERKSNHEISRKRIFVEHAIRFVKRFRILSERYRNRRKRFALRFSLIAGICNFDRLVLFRKRSIDIVNIIAIIKNTSSKRMRQTSAGNP